MIALETIGFTVAVLLIVTVTFLLFIGGPRYRHGRGADRPPGDGPHRPGSGGHPEEPGS